MVLVAFGPASQLVVRCIIVSSIAVKSEPWWLIGIVAMIDL